HATEIPETPRYWPLFHPVWRDGNDWFLLPGPASANGLEESRRDMRTFVRDPEKRVEALFQVEPYLEDRVVFWMLVHAKYSRKFRLVHDRDNPGVIYGHMDFRPLYRKYGVTAALDVHIR